MQMFLKTFTFSLYLFLFWISTTAWCQTTAWSPTAINHLMVSCSLILMAWVLRIQLLLF